MTCNISVSDPSGEECGLELAGSRMFLSWCELYLTVKLIVIYIAILHTVIN